MTSQEKTRMTVQEYLALPERMDRTELIDGELIVSPAPKYPHQAAVFAVAKLIDRGEGTTVIAPVDVHITGEQVVQPDVFWIRPGSTDCVLRDGYWHGPPDLVVEVLSPATAKRDRDEKYRIYEAAGVREYWLLDPLAEYVEVYVLREGKFARFGVFGKGESFTSPALADREVKLAEIW